MQTGVQCVLAEDPFHNSPLIELTKPFPDLEAGHMTVVTLPKGGKMVVELVPVS